MLAPVNVPVPVAPAPPPIPAVPQMPAFPAFPVAGGREARDAAAEALPEPGGTGGPAYEFLREAARGAGVWVHGGSLIERGAEKLHNTTVVFDPQGREVARYRDVVRRTGVRLES